MFSLHGNVFNVQAMGVSECGVYVREGAGDAWVHALSFIQFDVQDEVVSECE